MYTQILLNQITQQAFHSFEVICIRMTTMVQRVAKKKNEKKNSSLLATVQQQNDTTNEEQQKIKSKVAAVFILNNKNTSDRHFLKSGIFARQQEKQSDVKVATFSNVITISVLWWYLPVVLKLLDSFAVKVKNLKRDKSVIN